MTKKSLKEIMFEYSSTRGGGLPLTAEEICNAVVLWCQEYVEKSFSTTLDNTFYANLLLAIGGYVENIIQSINFEKPLKMENNTVSIPIEYLSELFEGSESIIVDVNEDNNAIEIHLDGTMLSKIDRAILTPLSNPQVDSVPVVSPTGAYRYEPYSAGGESNTIAYLVSGISYGSGPIQIIQSNIPNGMYKYEIFIVPQSSSAYFDIIVQDSGITNIANYCIKCEGVTVINSNFMVGNMPVHTTPNKNASSSAESVYNLIGNLSPTKQVKISTSYLGSLSVLVILTKITD